MTGWKPRAALLDRPAYLSLADQYGRAIREGALKPGDKLPPHRSLAFDLGLSVQTVSRAYRELIRRGLVSGQVGRGSFVLPAASEAAPPYLAERPSEIIDLSILKPVTEPMHLQRLREGLHWVADNMAAAAALSFRPSSVMPAHQRVAADWLRRGGIEVAPGAITITDGATPALTAAVMTAIPPGGALAAEALTHHLLMPLCKYLGLRLEGLAMDGQGMLPDALDHAARRGELRGIYLQPAAINPTATMMGTTRRAEIVEVARRHDLVIVENDMLNLLIEDRPPPLAALAPERVLHINGFTKSTLPGLRLAYLAVPERFAAAAANRHLVTNWVATPVMAELLSHWIADGTVDALIRWQRTALAARHALARRLLAGVAFRAHPQSLHIWMDLPEDRNEDEFVARARLRGVAIASGRAFRVGDLAPRPAIRVALGSTRIEDLRRGLGVVADLFRRAPAETPLPLL